MSPCRDRTFWPRSSLLPLLLRSARSVLDLLLPPQCLCCDARVETHGQLCAACFSQTTYITEPCCTRCGVPFAAAAQALVRAVFRRARSFTGLCAACSLARPP